MMGEEMAGAAEEISFLSGDAELSVFRTVFEGTGKDWDREKKEDRKEKKNLPWRKTHGASWIWMGRPMRL